VLRWIPTRGEVVEREGCGQLLEGTNNRAEMTAVLEGLRRLERRASVVIHTDSEYVMKAFTNGWIASWRSRDWRHERKRNGSVPNRDLWELLEAEVAKHQVEWARARPHRDRAERALRQARRRTATTGDRRAVRDQLASLEAGGYIVRSARWREGGGRSTDTVTLAIKAADSSGKPQSKPEDFAGSNRNAASALNRNPASGGSEPSVESSIEPSDISAVVVDVFEHWRQAFSLNGQTKLTDGRRTKIRARLKSYPVDRLKRAIDGCASSQWHRDNGHFDLELIFRSDTKLEEFERRAATAVKKPDYSAYDQVAN
jgi:ribonuclease HI